MAAPIDPKRVHEVLAELLRLAKEVEDVAAKTKLLGFNAAIVAAQAGEHGKPFLVVAEQMKALNQRTYQAAHALEDAHRRLHATVDP